MSSYYVIKFTLKSYHPGMIYLLLGITRMSHYYRPCACQGVALYYSVHHQNNASAIFEGKKRMHSMPTKFFLMIIRRKRVSSAGIK